MLTCKFFFTKLRTNAGFQKIGFFLSHHVEKFSKKHYLYLRFYFLNSLSSQEPVHPAHARQRGPVPAQPGGGPRGLLRPLPRVHPGAEGPRVAGGRPAGTGLRGLLRRTHRGRHRVLAQIQEVRGDRNGNN